MRIISSPSRLAAHHRLRGSPRSTFHRSYATHISSRAPKKSFFRSYVLPTGLFAGMVYGAGVYASIHNDKVHDFFVNNVPFGDTLINIYADANLEKIGEVSKRVIELTESVVKSAKEIVGLTPRAEVQRPPQDRTPALPIDQMKLKTEAAARRGKEVISNPVASDATQRQAEPESNLVCPIKVSSQVPPSAGIQKSVEPKSTQISAPVYAGMIPIGHEPPPGFVGSAPQPRDPSIDPIPPPPALPLIAPSIRQLSSSEPILGQLADTIDSLAGFLRDHPEVVVKGKDSSGHDAPHVLSSAETELKRLAERLDAIRVQEKNKLQKELDSQAKQYSKLLLDAERELHERLDQQEENWKDTFDHERSQLAQSFEAKLHKELETQEELINERLRQEVISQGIEMQKKWMREIKTQVELEREGRLGKLHELESCIKEIERVTLDNEEYLDENLRLHRLWNSLRAISAAAFDSPVRRSLTYETEALRNICQHSSKSTPDPKLHDVLSAAIDCIATEAIENGVEPLPNLTVWFKESVAPRIQSASLFPEHGGLLSYLASNLLSRFLFTNSQTPQGKDPISVVTRVNAYLDAKDLDMAARELNSLTGWPKVLARDWLQAARHHLELQQTISLIETETKLQTLLL